MKAEMTELELLRLMLSENFQGGQGAPEVWPDDVPTDLPAPLPLVRGARVLGSVAARESERTPWMRYEGRVYLDTDFDMQAADRAVADAALAAGWQPVAQGFFDSGGFADTRFEKHNWADAPEQLPSLFAYPPSETVLRRHLCPREGGCRVTLMFSQDTHYAQQVGNGGQSDLLTLPVLRAPEGAQLTLLGGSAGRGGDVLHAESSVRACGEVTADALREHFAAQLRAAGWHEDGTASGGGVSASRWSFHHQLGPGKALLSVAEHGAGALHATLSADVRLSEPRGERAASFDLFSS